MYFVSSFKIQPFVLHESFFFGLEIEWFAGWPKLSEGLIISYHFFQPFIMYIRNNHCVNWFSEESLQLLVLS